MTLQIAKFCEWDGSNLQVDTALRPKKMANSFGTGEELVRLNNFGADIIRFSAGEGVQNHTHPGDHILFVLSGSGYVIYEGHGEPLVPGICYLVKGEADHAIKASTDLVLIAVGNNHQRVDQELRMTPVPYRDETPELMRV